MHWINVVDLVHYMFSKCVRSKLTYEILFNPNYIDSAFNQNRFITLFVVQNSTNFSMSNGVESKFT